MASGTRHTVDEEGLRVTSVFAKTGDHAVLDHVAERDEEVLVALGYKQEFKRSGLYSRAIHAWCLTRTGTSPYGHPSLCHSPCSGSFPRLPPLWASILPTPVRLGRFGDGSSRLCLYSSSRWPWPNFALVCPLQEVYTMLQPSSRLRAGARFAHG